MKTYNLSYKSPCPWFTPLVNFCVYLLRYFIKVKAVYYLKNSDLLWTGTSENKGKSTSIILHCWKSSQKICWWIWGVWKYRKLYFLQLKIQKELPLESSITPLSRKAHHFEPQRNCERPEDYKRLKKGRLWVPYSLISFHVLLKRRKSVQFKSF